MLSSAAADRPAEAPGALDTRFAARTEALPDGALARIRFGKPPTDAADPRDVYLPLAALGADPGDELWLSNRPVKVGVENGVGFAHNGNLLFGQFTLLDCELDDYGAAAFSSYARITAFLEQMEYPWLVRCWNYLHDINQGDADHERYKQFCVGRYKALSLLPSFEQHLPAGTAIGMHSPGLLIYFIAARAPGTQVENPRQVPAFQYPRQYGPRSPSFSRATLLREGANAQLLVSGTASVIGHRTLHPHDAAAQLEETLSNIAVLLDHAKEQHLDPAQQWQAQTLRLYVRNRDDAAMAAARVLAVLGTDAPLLCLEGDICRTDLMLEMEAMYIARSAS